MWQTQDPYFYTIAIPDVSIVMYKLIKTEISNLVSTACFWNTINQVRYKSKDWEGKWLNIT
jgi:hypothetical protein